jgi:vitamin B12 transporter
MSQALAGSERRPLTHRSFLAMFSIASVPRARRLRALAALSGLVAGAPVHAQTPAAGPVLSPVVVTATRFDQPLADALPFTTVLTREDIERSQALDVPALLQREAGLAFANNGGRGKATSVFLRGASTRQVLVLLDGVPLNRQDASGAVSLEHVMLDAVERIEVVRGNVSALYGSAAIGGVIQIFTRRAGDTPRASVLVEGGSEDSRRASVAADGRLGATSLAGGVSVDTTDGHSALDPEQVPGANPDRDGYLNRSAWASVAHRFAPEQTLALRMHHSDGRFDWDSAFGAPSDVHRGRTVLDSLALTADNRYTDDWRGVITLSQVRDDNRNHVTGDFGYRDRYVSRTRLLGWSHKVALNADWAATAGLERQHQEVDVDDGFGGRYDRSRDVDAAYAGVEGRAGAHTLQLNLRRDRVEDVGGKTTGLLGYGLHLNADWKLTASVSTAFNAPPLGYLHAPFFGNPALEPERARSAELGVQYAPRDAGGQPSSTLLRATLFRSRIRDELEFDFASSRFENIGRTRNRGLEVAAQLRAAGIDWRAGLTWQDPRNEETGARLLRRAKRFGTLGASRELGAWEWGADVRASAPRDDVGPGGTSVKLGGYTLLDLRARWRFAPGWQLHARLENATDRDWQTVYGYPQAGRAAFVGVQWQPLR